MKRIIIIVVAVSLAASGATAQSASSRAWQQRLEVEIPLPIPMVELESINPFTANVDEPAVVLGSTAPLHLLWFRSLPAVDSTPPPPETPLAPRGSC